MAKSKSSQDDDFGWLEDKPRKNRDREKVETAPIDPPEFEPTVDLDDLEVPDAPVIRDSEKDDTTPLPPSHVEPRAIAATGDGEWFDATESLDEIEVDDPEKTEDDDESPLDRGDAVPIPPLTAIPGARHDDEEVEDDDTVEAEASDDPEVESLPEQQTAPVPIPNTVSGIIGNRHDHSPDTANEEGDVESLDSAEDGDTSNDAVIAEDENAPALEEVESPLSIEEDTEDFDSIPTDEPDDEEVSPPEMAETRDSEELESIDSPSADDEEEFSEELDDIEVEEEIEAKDAESDLVEVEHANSGADEDSDEESEEIAASGAEIITEPEEIESEETEDELVEEDVIKDDVEDDSLPESEDESSGEVADLSGESVEGEDEPIEEDVEDSIAESDDESVTVEAELVGEPGADEDDSSEDEADDQPVSEELDEDLDDDSAVEAREELADSEETSDDVEAGGDVEENESELPPLEEEKPAAEAESDVEDEVDTPNPIADAVAGRKQAESADKEDEKPEAAESKDDSDDDENENPISASVRGAASKKAAAKPEGSTPDPSAVNAIQAGDSVFLVDRASDAWFAEDSAEPEPGKVKPAKKRVANTRTKKKRGFFGFIATTFFILFLLFAAVGAGAWFARDYLIGRAETLAIQKLSDEGIYLNYSERTFVFPRGLVLSDVELFETEAKETVLLRLGNLGVDPNFLHLLSKRSAEGLNAVITVEDSAAEFFHEGQKVCEVTGITADLFANQEQVTVNRLRGTLNGLDFDIEGIFDLPERTAKQPESPAAPAEEQKANKGATDFSPLAALAESATFVAGEGGKNPLIRMTVDLDSDRSIHAEGRFSGQGFTWSGVPFDYASIGFDYSQKLQVTDLKDLQIGYEGGTITGRMQILSEQEMVNIDNLTANVNPLSLASHFDSGLKETLTDITLIDNPTFGVTGKLNLADFWASILVIDYHQWDGFTVKAGEKAIPFSALNGQFVLKEGNVKFDSFKANLAGGDVLIRGNMVPQEEGAPYSAIIEVAGLPIENLADTKDVKGLLSAQFRGRGALTNLSALTGTGDLKIESGKLYSVPVIGPIQNLLATVSPVFGNREKSTLQANYVIESGNLRTSDLEIRSEGTKIKVKGGIDLSDLTTDFDATASLEGPLGLAAELSSDLLTVTGSGPIDDPKIELKNIPEKLSEIANEGIEALGNLLEGTAPQPSMELPAGDEAPSNATPEPAPAPSNNVPAPAPAPAEPSTEQPQPPQQQ